jgi:hypothetical protein
MAAKMNHRGFEPAKLSEQVERFCSPSGHKLKAVTVAAAAQLHVDGSCFLP